MRVQDRLRRDLVGALRERDTTEVSMIRTLIGAIENAEAIEIDSAVDVDPVFRPDQPRRELSDEEVGRILESERAELAEAAAHYRDLGIEAQAEDLELRTSIVDRYLA